MSKLYRFTCIICPLGCYIEAELNGSDLKIRGCRCSRGEEWVREEILEPKRIVMSVVKVKNGEYPIVSVKTDKPVPKDMIRKIMKYLSNVEALAPIKVGDIVVENILDLGVNIIATRNVEEK
ncbi:DUF1667 domain-containing protein [Candidatus Aciduliprofundum boonei]|uniref:DUF1667 domain-containing protein n=1 Tax=Aciduliprofundum boonei (strain DSM 19572 / T469) TaxID=439481 RepID=D3TB57_ACIB4|nr:DUF1667 domain-containing protein [Candidatus Aciduliprofundum boonei]ADD09336.1 protein of unknown function DUF1667 [Aciduliprofundum boonei T469]HII54456.1 DUF1667 domain-containing protein [Candidatus Aciduliprofundum boonei]